MGIRIHAYAIRAAIMALAAGCSLSGLADDALASGSIVDEINASGGSVYISQPPELDKITNNAAADLDESKQAHGRMLGYRVQVFSDNNIRSAKSGAEYRKRTVEAALPDTRAYIIFDAPYWRVKFGDYRTYGEADEALQLLLQQYPQFASDAKIVKERINTSSRSNVN